VTESAYFAAASFLLRLSSNTTWKPWVVYSAAGCSEFRKKRK